MSVPRPECESVPRSESESVLRSEFESVPRSDSVLRSKYKTGLIQSGDPSPDQCPDLNPNQSAVRLPAHSSFSEPLGEPSPGCSSALRPRQDTSFLLLFFSFSSLCLLLLWFFCLPELCGSDSSSSSSSNHTALWCAGTLQCSAQGGGALKLCSAASLPPNPRSTPP